MNRIDTRVLLLLSQIYVHVCFIIGLFKISPLISIPSIVFGQIIFVGLCGTVFYHRIVTHKNPIHPALEKFLLILSWIGCSGSLIAWAGTHRLHHRYTDTEKDPHSPGHHGKMKAYWWSSGQASIVRYVPDLLRKPWYTFQHVHYFKVLWGLHLLGFLFLSNTLYWVLLIVPAFLMWFAGSSVNALCHDSHGPKTNPLLGFLHAGEGWHINHHQTVGESCFHDKYDWGYWIYKMIRPKSE